MKSLSLQRVALAAVTASISIVQASAIPGAFEALQDRSDLIHPRQCSWASHCAGASCGSDDDCSDVLTCINKVCGSAPALGLPSTQIIAAPPPASTAESCSWADHCKGILSVFLPFHFRFQASQEY
ncbi:hypothetical protein BKA61DRAFT_566168 [Leptodontidium sp. MPI-SDFR-AT-0119]|nr:hypothetical protein BKA61DRAFT_566168 [Leptodontidium sp. MPI-SDFR-AT-0119]